MIARAGQRDEAQIAVEHDGFRLGGHAGEAEPDRRLALVHHAAAGKIGVLRKMHDERVEVAGVGQRAAHDQRIRDGARAVEEGRGARLAKQPEFGDLAPFAPLGQRGHRQYAHAAGVAGAAQDEIHDGRVVDGGGGGRRRENRGDAAGRRRQRRRRDGLAVLGAGLADEGQHVDEARRDDIAAAIDDPRSFRRARGGDRRPEIPDAPVLDIKPAARLAPARGIDKAGVDENQRRSGGRGGVGHGPLL